MEQVRHPCSKAVDSDEENSLELQTFDVVYVEHTHLQLVSDIPSVSTPNDTNILWGQGGAQLLNERIDLLFAVNENSDRRQLPRVIVKSGV